MSKKKNTITYNDKTFKYSYFSYLGHYIKYGGVSSDVIIELPVEYEIFIDDKIRWKYPKK